MLLEEADGQAAAKAAATSMAHKSPMLSAILDACETLKALQASSSSPSSPPAAAAGGNGGNGNNDGNGNQKHTFSGEALAGAKGLIFMRTDKIGFGVSVTQGYGLLLARRGPCSWSPPLPLKIDGCSLGCVAGYAEQRTLLALGSDDELRELCGGGGHKQDEGAAAGEKKNNKKKDKKVGGGGRVKVGLDLTLGLGKRLNQSASVDAKGGGSSSGERPPASAAEATPSSSVSSSPAAAATRAFTLSKGYIVDVSLRGLFVEPDADDMARAYGEGITAEDVLFGGAAGGGGGGGGGEEGGPAAADADADEAGATALVTAPVEAALLYRALKAAEEGAAAKA